MITPSRLKLARQRRGWTLKKLSEESGVPVRTLSSWENDAHEPNNFATVEVLARALGTPPQFLTADDIEPLNSDAVSWRKLSKTTAGNRHAALAAGSIAMEVSGWIESNFKIPDPDLPTLEKHDPETAGRILRERWGLGELPISNAVHLVESHGVRVFSLASDCRSVDAFSLYRDGRPFIFLNTAMSGERQRFDTAHELGHLVLHADADVAHGRDKEQEANRFAASLLMPARGVTSQGLREASLSQILEAKVYWKVAAMAMTHRLHELGLLSEWGYRSTCIALSNGGYRRSEPGGIKPETSQVLTKVLQAMRISGSGMGEIADQLDITTEELNLHLFGLAPTAVTGGGERSPRRASLNVVH